MSLYRDGYLSRLGESIRRTVRRVIRYLTSNVCNARATDGRNHADAVGTVERMKMSGLKDRTECGAGINGGWPGPFPPPSGLVQPLQ